MSNREHTAIRPADLPPAPGQPPELIPAALYLRMSTKMQEQARSPEQQRADAIPVAKAEGCEIVAEFVDAGKSGSRDQHKRTEFWRMIEEAEAGRFKVIICWDKKRFSREHPWDAIDVKNRLRHCGVRLLTVRHGWVDWNTFEGQLKDLIDQHAARDEVKEFADKSVRGRNDAVDDGWWPHGKWPFGFMKAVCDPITREPLRYVRHGMPPDKGKGQKIKLVHDEDEAPIVQWIYEQFVHRDTSLRQIARELVTRGVPAPSGNPRGWSYKSVADLLRNPAYAGDMVIGRKPTGEHARTKPKVRPNALPAIIDRAAYDLAQAKLQRNREERRKPRGNAPSILCGLVYCKKCGYRMVRKQRGGRACFVCPSASHRPHLECRQWAVRESVLRSLLNYLPGLIDRELLTEAQPKRGGQGSAWQRELTRLEAQAEQMRRRVQNANRNYLVAEPGAQAAGLYDALLALRNEQAELDARIEAARIAAADEKAMAAVLEDWRKEREKLTVLSNYTREDDDEPFVVETERARELLRRLGARLEIEWDTKGRGKGARRRPGTARLAARFLPDGCKAYFRRDEREGHAKYPLAPSSTSSGGSGA